MFCILYEWFQDCQDCCGGDNGIGGGSIRDVEAIDRFQHGGWDSY